MNVTDRVRPALAGFEPYECEWWHFTLADEPYPDRYFSFPVSVASVRA